MRKLNFMAYEPLVRYSQRVLTKESPFELRRHQTKRYFYPCPGHVGHAPYGRYPVGMFNRWVGRGNKAYGIYWRTHPKE